MARYGLQHRFVLLRSTGRKRAEGQYDNTVTTGYGVVGIRRCEEHLQKCYVGEC